MAERKDMNNNNMKITLQITKALADLQRVRILMLLRKRELCVCQIIAVLELAQSTISKHLSILSSAGLVENRKDGRWAYYRLPDDSADIMVRSALQWIGTSLRRDAAIGKDAEKLADVLKCDQEVLCQQRRKC
jgi:DNA-binding transcriptional ArsR family regulator